MYTRSLEEEHFMKRTLVWVQWCDVYMDHGPVALEHFNADGILIESAGLLIKETKKSIILAFDYYMEDNKYRELVSIPKIYIKKMKKVIINI